MDAGIAIAAAGFIAAVTAVAYPQAFPAGSLVAHRIVFFGGLVLAIILIAAGLWPKHDRGRPVSAASSPQATPRQRSAPSPAALPSAHELTIKRMPHTQVPKVVTPQTGLRVELPRSGPALPSELPSPLADENYFNALGCAAMPGVPDQITMYTGLEDAIFRRKLGKLTADLRAFDKVYNGKMKAAASIDYGDNLEARQNGIQNAAADIGAEYHKRFGDQPIGAFRELLKRLNMPSPQSTASGLSKEGFAAVCFQDSLRGAHPLIDLSTYLDRLANQLPG